MRKQQNKIKDNSLARKTRRRLSIRRKVEGTSERPRLCVNKSNKNLMIQVIDDESSITLCTIQTFGKNAVIAGSNKKSAAVVGEKIAEKLKEIKVSSVVFDRRGDKFTGILATIADKVKENGIQI